MKQEHVSVSPSGCLLVTRWITILLILSDRSGPSGVLELLHRLILWFLLVTGRPANPGGYADQAESKPVTVFLPWLSHARVQPALSHPACCSHFVCLRFIFLSVVVHAFGRHRRVNLYEYEASLI